MFDYERFTTALKLAYRRCGGSVYSIEEVLQVFRYYFDTYEMIFGEPHPMISVSQIAGMIEKMPFLPGDKEAYFCESSLTPEDYKAMIDQHFLTKYGHCDYNINHFFSGRIRELRFYEVCY